MGLLPLLRRLVRTPTPLQPTPLTLRDRRNALFIPVIYFYYIETAGRTLEEIDLIFATGFAQGRSYVRVANELPKLEDKEIQSELARLHKEHLARKGQSTTAEGDDRTFVEAGDEVRGEMANEKAKDIRGGNNKEAV